MKSPAVILRTTQDRVHSYSPVPSLQMMEPGIFSFCLNSHKPWRNNSDFSSDSVEASGLEHWGYSSVARVLAWNTLSPGFDPPLHQKQGMTEYASHHSTPEVEAKGSEICVILGYIMSLRPACATRIQHRLSMDRQWF